MHIIQYRSFQAAAIQVSPTYLAINSRNSWSWALCDHYRWFYYVPLGRTKYELLVL